MINWQSILSSFDDKPTLLEWLKKVQKALNESVLKTVTVSQKKSANINIIALSFNFEDGTKIETPAFYIQDGADGVGITDIMNTSLYSGKITVTYDTTHGITIFADMEQFYRDKRHVSKVTYAVPLMPGNGINIDKRENTEEVEIKADANGFKTIFGNISVVGSGNIDLYIHTLTFTFTPTAGDYDPLTVYAKIPSSNNLNIDSLTDLKTVLGNTFNESLYGGKQIESSDYGVGLYMTETALYWQLNGHNIYPNTWANVTITDRVKTI